MTQPDEQPPLSSFSLLAIYQDMFPCEKCAGQQIFVQVYEFEGGRWGYCSGCGQERWIRFTRATGEAA